VKEIKEVCCAKMCGLKEFCMEHHPWQYPFEHKEGYEKHGIKREWFEFWLRNQQTVDYAEEREKRIDGDPKYAEGTFVEPKN